MKKQGVEIRINFSNRVLYTLIVIGILAIVGVGVYAWANPETGVGHDLSELEVCSNGQILQMSGGEWTCADNLEEADPTVKDWAKSDTSIVLSSQLRAGSISFYSRKTSSDFKDCSTLCASTPSGVDILSGTCINAWKVGLNDHWISTSCDDKEYSLRCFCVGVVAN